MSLDRKNDRRLATLILCIAFFWLTNRWIGFWSLDMSAIYYAARSWALGQHDLIYLSTPGFFGFSASVEWQEMAAAQGHPDQVVLPYVYPPVWAALLAPVAERVGPQTFFSAAVTLQIAAILAAVPAAHRITQPHRIPLWLWSLVSVALIGFSLPFFFAFFYNQPQLLITALCLWAFAACASGRQVSSGVLLGIAAAIKVMPIGLALIFLMDRSWRALAAALVVSGGFALLSFIVAGPALHTALLEQLGRLGATLFVGNLNFGLDAVLADLTVPDRVAAAWNAQTNSALIEPLTWTPWVSRSVFLLGVIAVWRLPKGSDHALVVRLIGLSLLLALCGPLGWVHYLILPLLLLPGLLALVPDWRGWAVFLLLSLPMSEQLYFLLDASDKPGGPLAVIYALWAFTIIGTFVVLARLTARFARH